MKVNIYVYQTIRGPRRQQGYGIAVLEAETANGPVTKTVRMQVEGSENGANLKALNNALNHLKTGCDLNIYTESVWLTTALTEWLPIWRGKEYLSAKNEKVAFSDIWQNVGNILEKQNMTVFCKNEHPYREWLKKNAKTA